MKPRSLVSRLALLQQLTSLAIVVIFTTSSLWLMGRVLDREERNMLHTAARRMADNLDREIGEGGSLDQTAREILAEEPASRIHWEILDSRLHPLASSSPRERNTPGSAALPTPGAGTDPRWRRDTA